MLALETSTKLREVLSQGSDPHLMTGEQYKESLRDGRRIIDSKGKEVEDPVTHPHLRRGIETIARIYDQQFDPKAKEFTTYFDQEESVRYGTGWLVPKTKKDLKLKRDMLQLSTYETFGVFGRPNDYGSTMALGFLSVIDRLEKDDPATAQNVREFVKFSQQHNIISADLIADVQTDRNVPRPERPGRLRVVEERSDGVILSGAKPCGSVAAQGHFVTVSTVLSPGLEEDAALWCAVPLNSKGLTIVLREPVTPLNGEFEDHPIDAHIGEEADNMLLFDNVFLPNELLFSIGNLELLDLYNETGGLFHWHILSRLAYRAEIFAGAAQTIVDVLGTNTIQGVKEAVTDIFAYAATLKAFVLAAEEEAKEENGVLIPSREYITAGRLHSITEYPKIMHILRDLSGQGLISRFTKKTWEHPEIGPVLEKYLPGTGVSAMEKNRFFNFVWDLTTSSHAGRVALFENLNATNSPIVRNDFYNLFDREKQTKYIREYLDLPIV